MMDNDARALGKGGGGEIPMADAAEATIPAPDGLDTLVDELLNMICCVESGGVRLTVVLSHGPEYLQGNI
jgi:hypothetical protein